MHAPLHGLRLVFFSDIHANPRFSTAALEALFAQIQALKPHIVLIGGDFAEDANSLSRLLHALKVVRPSLGIYGCMGNNDSELPEFSALVETHVRMLVNKSIRVQFGSGSLIIGGVDDYRHGTPDATGLFCETENAFRVLLSHYPLPVKYGNTPRADLQLSGHTHGGQFNILGLTPFSILFERTSHCWISGECVLEGVRTIVSNGLGMSRIPLRIGVPPQIHLVEFHKE